MGRIRRWFLVGSVCVTVLVAGVLLAAGRIGDDLYRALGNLGEVLYLVSNNYVDPVNPEQLESGLVAGLLWSLDPSAALLAEEELDEFQQMVEAPPAFGLMLTQRLDSAAVRQVLPGSPAAQSGLQQWEIIERIDGVNSLGRASWQIRMELWRKYREAQAVELTVVDQTVDERRTVVLEPQAWQLEPVDHRVLDEVPVVSIRALAAGTSEELRQRLQSSPPVVLDLRELAWGLESEAIAVADLFAAEGVLGHWKGTKAGERQFAATGSTVAAELPVVVVSPTTEGVGEVLAAAFARLGAPIVGATTAGHARHSQLVHDEDLHLWLPVASWLGPEGKPLDDAGLEPTVVVEPDEDAPDRALERAVALVLERYAEAA